MTSHSKIVALTNTPKERVETAAMTQSYKLLKEDFVSNLTGGEIPEINAITAVAPVCSKIPGPCRKLTICFQAATFLWSVLQSRQGFFNRYGLPALIADSMLNVGGILLAITLYSSNTIVLNALLVCPALLVYFLPPASSRAKRHSKPDKPLEANGGSNQQITVQKLNPLPIRPFVTTYRGAMMVTTCLAILAVDFRIFPRRFAKVENWGTSLMDLGVGSFVFSAGVVGAKPLLVDTFTGRAPPVMYELQNGVKHSIPLLVLGLVRLYSVKGLDYAEHVTEYGVHWNFFFTLALLPPSVALISFIAFWIPSRALLSLLIIGTYQILLRFTNLQAYILTASRTDLLSQNREGVFSFFGYLAIFLAGQATGIYSLPRNSRSKLTRLSTLAKRKHLLLLLAAWSAAWTIMLYTSTSYKYGLGLSVSRRLANLPYVLWVSAFNCSQLTIFCLIETVMFPKVYKATNDKTEKEEIKNATSMVLSSYNKNGLALFLLANLSTGLVNLTVDTLSVGRVGAMGILVTYATILTATAVILDNRGWSLKL